MAWIESHQDLLRHRKVLRLADALHLPERTGRHTAIGLLHALWWYALDYAEDGSLADVTPRELADGLLWPGDPDTLVGALVTSRWLDPDEDGLLHVHDWARYIAPLIKRREQNRERARTSRIRYAHGTRTVPVACEKRAVLPVPVPAPAPVPAPEQTPPAPVGAGPPTTAIRPPDDPDPPPVASVPPRRTRAPARHPWPDGLALDAQLRAFAGDCGVDADVEWPQFRDDAASNARVHADWRAAWRTWCRNAANWRNQRRIRAQGASPGCPAGNGMEHDDRPEAPPPPIYAPGVPPPTEVSAALSDMRRRRPDRGRIENDGARLIGAHPLLAALAAQAARAAHEEDP